MQCTKFHEHLINHVGEYAITKCILNCLKISKSPKRPNRGKTQWAIKSFILQSSHIMILNFTKFGGNRTKDLEVGPDRQTDRQANSHIPPKLRLQGGIMKRHFQYLTPPHFNWSSCTNPEKWAILYMCVRSIDFPSVSMIVGLSFGTIPTE